MNSNDLFQCFHDEEAAHRLVEAYAWPEGPVCPHCGESQRIGELHGNSTQIGTYKCYRCRKLFTVKCGTIFHSSHVPLRKWVLAMYLTGCGTENVRANELSGALNVSFKTATFILRRLQYAARESGIVPLNRREDEPEEQKLSA